jgi:CubicO group peptidase (beta-lactamase class C family)
MRMIHRYGFGQDAGVSPKAALAACCGMVLALGGRLDAAAAPAFSRPEMTAADVEAFLDGLVPTQLAREDIAGAVVAVVKDGRLLVGKGYGWADGEARRPVSFEETLFRPGSVSKLFTWTAVMQQVEQGKLDLDRDVNEYLDFQIPATYPQPITLRDAMTHTPGFEDRAKNLFVASPAELRPLGSYLALHVPARIYPPGTTPAYCNYATALAGYVVERVSGKAFASYVDDSIFRPLGMSRSTFAQPLPQTLDPLMSNGYRLGSGEPQPFEFLNPSPAGALSTTGADMARFVIAHLQEGRFGDRQILRPDTARRMQAHERGWAPPANGITLGFWEESRNGHRIIGHAGDTMWFHSDLHLIPEAGVGFYVSYNSAGRAEVSPRDYLWESFLDRYFPYQPPAAARRPVDASDANAVAGSYLVSRRADSSFLRLLYVLSEIGVTPRADGTLEIPELRDVNGQPKRWQETAPLIFREVDGQDLVLFQGRGAGMELATFYWHFVFERPRWFEDKRLLLPVATATLAVLFSTLLLWPVGALLRRHFRKPLKLESGVRRLRLLARLVCAIDVAGLLGFAAVVVLGFQDLTLFSARLDPCLRVLQALCFLGVAGTLIALASALWSWRSRARGLWSKFGETLIAMACVGFVWLALVGRLLHVGPAY